MTPTSPVVLVLPLAKEVARILFTNWLRDRPLPKGAALGMEELVEGAADKFLDRKRIARQFDRLVDRIAAQLEPLVDSEFRDVPDSEVRAVVLLVEEVLREAELSAGVFASADGEATAVEARVRELGARRIGSGHLSASGEALFDLLLRESTSYLLELAVCLPTFRTAAIQELLRRETLLIDRVDEVFEQLPKAPQFLGGTVASAAAVFETQYRRALSRKLDEVELFGIDLPEHRRRYNLNVAYISLLLDVKGEEEGEGGGVSSTSEHVLDPLPRALITGDAGSGKTTLLQWLAVKACRGDAVGEESEWGDRVPFFIPLRRYAKKDLPTPEEFVVAATPQLAGVMPHGWVHDQLDSGRGLVLVDGVDELPPARREDVRRWLDELVATFPETRYVVTSRPPAVSEGWLDDQDFAALELQPMSLPDITSFILHWHAAALNDPQDGQEKAELERLSGSLLEVIRTDRAVRSLATSPLLCAMLCALHRDRKSHLPRGRLEVYRVALEGLIDRRDVEREVISGLPAQSLSLPEKLVLLRDLSYWLMVNGYAFAPAERCIDRIAQKLPSMPHLDYSAEEVFAYLLTRSGVLREPVPGAVDFLHRTFQEYLAASEVIEQDNVGQLIASAHSDEWREVTILAAGQARRDQREQLLDGLLERGQAEPDYSYRLHLLAVACLDTLVELSPERTEELQGILAELIPPRTITDANALASAGDLAVPLLGACWQGEKARTTAACVRSLGLIGGEQSLYYLEQIAPDTRMTVGREIVRMWDEFDPEEYAARVLSKSPIFRHRSLKMPPEQALLAPYLPGLEGLQIGGFEAQGRVPEGRLSVRELARCADLESLIFEDLSGDVDLEAIPTLPGLIDLTIKGCQVKNLGAVGACAGLKSLELARQRLVGIDFLPGLGQLEVLRIHGCAGLRDLAPIAALRQLHTLELSDTDAGEGFGFLEPLALERLQLTGLDGGDETDWLDSQAQLTSLTIDYSSGDLSPLLGHAGLEELELVIPGVAELSSMETSQVKRLYLREAGDLVALDALRRCPELEALEISSATSLTDLTPLLDCPNLRRLTLGGSNVSDITVLTELPNLERLDLRNTAVEDFSPLRDLPKLEWLFLKPGFYGDAIEQMRGSPVRFTTLRGSAVGGIARGRRYYPSLQALSRA
jgi:Leucine-rich repeat (LRR) protein